MLESQTYSADSQITSEEFKVDHAKQEWSFVVQLVLAQTILVRRTMSLTFISTCILLFQEYHTELIKQVWEKHTHLLQFFYWCVVYLLTTCTQVLDGSSSLLHFEGHGYWQCQPLLCRFVSKLMIHLCRELQ